MWLWQCHVCPFRLWLHASLSNLRSFGLIIFSSLILIPNSWYLASHPTHQSGYNFLYSNVWLPGQQQRKTYMIIPRYLRGIVSRTPQLPHLKPTKSELAFWQDYQEIQMNVKIWETALCTTSWPEDVSYLPGIWGTPGILGTAHTPIIHSTSCEWVIFQPNPEHEKKMTWTHIWLCWYYNQHLCDFTAALCAVTSVTNAPLYQLSSLHTKLLQNIVPANSKHLFSHSFWGSGKASRE